MYLLDAKGQATPGLLLLKVEKKLVPCRTETAPLPVGAFKGLEANLEEKFGTLEEMFEGLDEEMIRLVDALQTEAVVDPRVAPEVNPGIKKVIELDTGHEASSVSGVEAKQDIALLVTSESAAETTLMVEVKTDPKPEAKTKTSLNALIDDFPQSKAVLCAETKPETQVATIQPKAETNVDLISEYSLKS